MLIMIKVAIIDHNKCDFSGIIEYFPDLLYVEPKQDASKRTREYIGNVFNDYVTYHDIPKHELLDFATGQLINDYPHLKPESDLFFHTEKSFTTPKGFMEIIYCTENNLESIDESRVNNLACLLSLKHSVIYSRCIVLFNNYDLSAPKLVSLGDICPDNIISAIKRRYYFSAILLTTDGQRRKYYYQNIKALLEKVLGVTDNDNICVLNNPLFLYNLCYYFKDNQNTINKEAILLDGENIIKGDVLLATLLDHNIPSNLSKGEVNNLLKISHGRMYDRDLKDKERHDEEVTVVENERPIKRKVKPYWSKHIIVASRLEEKIWQKCSNCATECDGSLRCEKCYRIIYCSNQCKKEYAGNHGGVCSR